MDATRIRAAIDAALVAVAPEIDPRSLKADQPLRRQVDLDSMDWLNFLTSLHQSLHVDIPESEYRRLDSIDALLRYIAQAQAQAQAQAAP